MGSTRLPGKVMMDLGGKPVIQWVIDAASHCKLVDQIVVATTEDPKDDVLADYVNHQHPKFSNLWTYRGEVNDISPGVNDVTKRMLSAARNAAADIIVRVTGDCPFQDSNVIDQVIALRETTDADYACNTDPPTWPDGLDCEAFTMDALEIVNREATTVLDRNCVTSYIYHNQHKFKCETLICPLPGMHKERWVLDTEDDYKFCQLIATHCHDQGWLRTKLYLDRHPELRKINAHHPRNERFYAAMATEPLTPRAYEESKRLLTKAEEIIPLGTQTFSKSKIQYPSESPLFVTHGDGGYCFDVDGNRYVDLVGGLLPVILRHRDPDVDYAIRRQLNKGISHSLATGLEIQLAETLCRLIPCAEWARFGKNGSDVTSAAVRLARAHTGRDYIISSGYHGWHDWAVGHDAIRRAGTIGEQKVCVLKHGDVEGLWREKEWQDRKIVRRPIAAVIVEPETDPEFLKECRKFCDETGALLIYDEIITGFRFDLGGAQKLYGITPDLACFGKAMANGMPISALVGRQEFYKTMEKISYSGTFFGETLSLAAAIATIEKLERENALLKIADEQTTLSYETLRIQSQPPLVGLIGDVHLPRLRFPDNDVKTLFIQEMAQQGVLILGTHNLSYAHDDNCIQRVVTAYKHVLPLLADAIESGKVKQLIKGRSIPAYANVRASS